MAVSGMQFGWLGARDFHDDLVSHSVTVQVRNRDAVADIGLYSKWVTGEEDHAVLAHISQIVSDSGVENFPTSWDAGPPPTLFRRNVTSVTFKVVAFQAHVMARWMIYRWV